MVKANFSFGGKALFALVTVIIYTIVLVGGIVGGAFYAYKNVKLDALLTLINQTELLSDAYRDKTIEQFVKDIQTDLSGEGLTLRKLTEISPKAGEMLDSVIDNVNQNGIVTIDSDALYDTPVQSLSSSLADVAVITATLNSLGDTMGFALPDMPLLSGAADGEAPLDIYAAANDNEEGTIDKAFLFGEYEYYTQSISYDAEQATELTDFTLYSLIGVTEQDGYLKKDGKFLYLRTQTEGGDFVYSKVKSGNSVVYDTPEAGTYRFTDDRLYTATGLGAAGTEYAQVSFSQTEQVREYVVQPKYRYRPLYTAEGVLASAETPDENGRYAVLNEYKNQDLYIAKEVYGLVTEDQLTDEFLKANTVYVKSNGIGDLPLVSGINELSAALDMNAMTLSDLQDYFGISLENDLLQDVFYTPLAYFGNSLDDAIQNTEIGTILDLNQSSNALLLYLAYGDKSNYDFDAEGNVVMKEGRKPNTIADLSGVLDNATIGDMIDLGENPSKLISAVADWTMNDFADADKVNGLKLGDLLELGENPPAILLALQHTTLGDLSSTINTLSLKDMIGAIDPSNNVLYALKDCTLDTLADNVAKLALQDLFADDIYEYVYIGTKETYDTRYEDLYVYTEGEYTSVSAGGLSSYSTDTKVYARYTIAYVGGTYENDAFRNVPLYAYEGGAYVEATCVSAYALPDGAPDTTYYKKEGGQFVAVATGGTFDVDTLYYLNADDETVEVKLVAAELQIKAEYQTAKLYSRYKLAETYKDGSGKYGVANLYYYDLQAQEFRRIDDLVAVTEDGTDNTPIIGYNLPSGYEDTVLFTNGETRGIWKYLLTNENNIEEIASINSVGTLLSNVSANINNKTLREMHEDGVLFLDDPSILDTHVPALLGGGLLGDKNIKELLSLTANALSMIP